MTFTGFHFLKVILLRTELQGEVVSLGQSREPQTMRRLCKFRGRGPAGSGGSLRSTCRVGFAYSRDKGCGRERT